MRRGTLSPRSLLAVCARVACVAYIAVLWAAVIPANLWPFSQSYVPRQIYLDARRLMTRLTLTAGEVIFTGTVGEWKIAANCLRVTGAPAIGEALVLYANECPNRSGLRLYNPPFDQVLQEMTRIEITPALGPDSLPMRRILDITQYFCRSPLESHPPLRSVAVSQVLQVQSIDTGSYFQNAELHCEMSCTAAPQVAPVCVWRGQPRPLG
jgi:hypothetical protein